MEKFDEAIEIIRRNLKVNGTETVLLSDSMYRILAEDVRSDVNVPPFNKAAMDGFACKRSDLPGPLTIVEDIPAGKFPEKKLGKGECSRIMVGAPVPQGADTVIVVENHEIQPDGTVLFTGERSADNICLIGEDVKEGELILEKGTLIRPEEIAILSGAGYSSVDVYSRPKIGVLSTGTELVEPYDIPRKGQIRNSNGHQMLAQLRKSGFVAEYFGIVEDSKEEILGKVQSALKLVDVLFISGGVSVGDYDYVPQVLMELDYDILITLIATKPGKHTLFAKNEDKYVLGFPGNPVSSFIQLELIGKELVYGLMNHSPRQQKFKSIFVGEFKREEADRLEFVPVKITDSGKIDLLPYNGSAHIHAISKANAFMEIPIGVTHIEAGDQVTIRPL